MGVALNANDVVSVPIHEAAQAMPADYFDWKVTSVE